MTDSSLNPQKRVRSGGRKVRTGCVTCKIRRVKCDEAKPACQRCTSTGRKCDGYAIIPPKAPKREHTPGDFSENGSSKCVTILPRQLFASLGSADERRSMEFFHKRMAPKLSGYFDGLFWNRLLLQLSQNEPAIRHAIMAISSMYERFESSADQDLLLPAAEDRFALMSYTKAINLLSRRLSGDSQSVHVPLVACILFICLEFLRRDIDAAMTHMHSGFAILRARTNRISQNKGRPTKDENDVEETMLSMFARLRILSGLFGRPAPPMKVYEGPLQEVSDSPLNINSFSEARTTLITRMAPCLVFVRICSQARYESTISSEYHVKQASLKTSLTEWKSSFEKWYAERKSNSKEDQLAANFLRLHYGITEIWVKLCLCPNETAFDDYTDDFQEMVDLASTLTNAPLAIPEEFRSHFSFEMGAVPALYFVAVKCRHPVIRRRAIGLLLSSPRREGLWDAYRAGRVAERVMLREEVGLKTGRGYLQAYMKGKQFKRKTSTPNTQPRSTSTSRTVPYITKTMDLEAESALNLQRMLAEEYQTSTAYDSSDPKGLTSLAQSSLKSVTESPTQSRIHETSELSQNNVVGISGMPMQLHWDQVIEDVQFPSEITPVDDPNFDNNLPLNDADLAPCWDQEATQISTSELPTSDPGPLPWPAEEFRIHHTSYAEDGFVAPHPSENTSTFSATDLQDIPSAHMPSPTHDFFTPPSATTTTATTSSTFATTTSTTSAIPLDPSSSTTNNPNLHLSNSPGVLSIDPFGGPSTSALAFYDDLAADAFAHGLDPDDYLTPADRLPREQQRIHDIMPTKMPGELQRIHDARIANEVAAPFKRSVQPVTFRWKPNGLDGEWQVWGETIRL